MDAERNTVVLHSKTKLFIELYFLLLYVKLFGIDKVESFILLCLRVWFQAWYSLFIQNYANFIFMSLTAPPCPAVALQPRVCRS